MPEQLGGRLKVTAQAPGIAGPQSALQHPQPVLARDVVLRLKTGSLVGCSLWSERITT